ncbi:MAG: hypothetical protein U5P10_12775 [Spirochaetia bacterium]|nr:hypothetical protein [Spirochaetia bacterium]
MTPKSSSIRSVILKEFENDYPHSAQIRGGRALRKGRWERIFPGIETDPQLKDEFISAAEELEAAGGVVDKVGPPPSGRPDRGAFPQGPGTLASDARGVFSGAAAGGVAGLAAGIPGRGRLAEGRSAGVYRGPY